MTFSMCEVKSYLTDYRFTVCAKLLLKDLSKQKMYYNINVRFFRTLPGTNASRINDRRLCRSLVDNSNEFGRVDIEMCEQIKI